MGAEWLLTVGAIFGIICTLLAYKGFRGRVNTIGVDLGTTFSVIGSNINGKVVIFEDKLHRNIFPSIVYYMENGTTRVSYDAVPYLTLDPQSTIYNAKRFIGKSLDSDDVTTYASSHPFEIMKIDKSVSNFSEIGFALESQKGRIIAPEHVGHEVVKHLLKVASDFLGYSNTLTKVVIAVPAKFDAAQKQATAQAFKLAGLKVVRILEEPTAAAVAYGLHKNSSINYIAVYDFGGGTLDVCLLYVRDKSVQVYAFDGDDSLGGSDFDICLANVISQKVEKLAQVDLSSIFGTNYVKSGSTFVNNDLYCNPSVIRTKAESIKKQLSSQASVRFECQIPGLLSEEIGGPSDSSVDSSKYKYIYDIASDGSVDVSGSDRLVAFDVSVEDFETGCGSLFSRSLEPIDRLMADLGMKPSDIDEVVLVGGSTRIPKIKRDLREYFQKPLNDHIDPDITVAYGAASVID